MQITGPDAASERAAATILPGPWPEVRTRAAGRAECSPDWWTRDKPRHDPGRTGEAFPPAGLRRTHYPGEADRRRSAEGTSATPADDGGRASRARRQFRLRVPVARLLRWPRDRAPRLAGPTTPLLWRVLHNARSAV